jgi:hypothetical protein
MVRNPFFAGFGALLVVALASPCAARPSERTVPDRPAMQMGALPAKPAPGAKQDSNSAPGPRDAHTDRDALAKPVLVQDVRAAGAAVPVQQKPTRSGPGRTQFASHTVGQRSAALTDINVGDVLAAPGE